MYKKIDPDTSHKEYKIWDGIKQRCNNSKCREYKYYGGRGIQISKEWQNSFRTFLNDMGERPSDNHSIERLDNDKNYCKENCKWVTKKEQANNTRHNVLIEHEGKTQNLTQWCEELKLDYKLIHSRLRRGKTFIEAISTPRRITKLTPKEKRE